MRERDLLAVFSLGGMIALAVPSCTLEEQGTLPPSTGGHSTSVAGAAAVKDAEAGGKADSSIQGGGGGFSGSESGGSTGSGGASGSTALGGSAGQAGTTSNGGGAGTTGAGGETGNAGEGGAIPQGGGGSVGNGGSTGQGGAGGGFSPLDLTIKDDDRDGWDDSGTAEVASCFFGDAEWSDVGGYQWAVPLPQGTVIQDAYVRLFSNGPNGNHHGYQAEIRVEEVDNAAPFNNTGGNIYNRAWWTVGVSWSIPDTGLPGHQWSDTPSLKDLVQHVLDRPGWASGNYLSISIRGTTGDTGCAEVIVDSSDDPAKAAELHIE